MTDEDGNVVERAVPELDVLKDLSGAGPEKTWVEKHSVWLAAAFLAVSVTLAAVLIHVWRKRPDLFRLRERGGGPPPP